MRLLWLAVWITGAAFWLTVGWLICPPLNLVLALLCVIVAAMTPGTRRLERRRAAADRRAARAATARAAAVARADREAWLNTHVPARRAGTLDTGGPGPVVSDHVTADGVHRVVRDASPKGRP